MKPLKVGMLGCGVVGGGTMATLLQNQEEIKRRSGRDIVVEKIAVRDISKQRDIGIELPKNKVVSDWRTVVNDPDIDVIVELVGGDGVAKEMVIAAINNGKHVVTANKALLAKHGNDIFKLAAQKEVIVAFEAAVAGGIPIIKALREGLSGNRIDEVMGIINGTCNYILSNMYEHGHDFNVVLSEAQRLGYAEQDPSFDIDGIDAQHKLTILGALAFGVPMQLDKVSVEGIRHLKKTDLDYADSLGYRVKLLGIARRVAKGLEMRVHPTLVPKKELIANVEGVMNAVRVKGDRVGNTLFYGPGAGANPTASAVVADLVDVARLATADPTHHVPYMAFQHTQLHDSPILSANEVESGYYLRLHTLDQVGVMADLTKILAEYAISIDAILQYERPSDAEARVDVVLLIHKVREGTLRMALEKIARLPFLIEPVTMIRREDGL